MNPGGDAAFDAAAKRSAHSHFGLVRLPKTNDDKSELTQKNLPSLWVQTAPPESKELSTVALIPPVLPGVAVKPLGYNNGFVDRDGILRRYRYFERLDDGGMIQSLPMSVVQQVDPKAHAFWLERFLIVPCFILYIIQIKIYNLKLETWNKCVGKIVHFIQFFNCLF